MSEAIVEQKNVSPKNATKKQSNLSKHSARYKERKQADWPYKNIKFNEQVAVYEVPAYDKSRFAGYYADDPYDRPTSCCIVQ